MSFWNPLDDKKDELAKHGKTTIGGILTAYWTGQQVKFRATSALNSDIKERQRRHGWTATQQPPEDNA